MLVEHQWWQVKPLFTTKRNSLITQTQERIYVSIKKKLKARCEMSNLRIQAFLSQLYSDVWKIWCRIIWCKQQIGISPPSSTLPWINVDVICTTLPNPNPTFVKFWPALTLNVHPIAAPIVHKAQNLCSCVWVRVLNTEAWNAHLRMLILTSHWKWLSAHCRGQMEIYIWGLKIGCLYWPWPIGELLVINILTWFDVSRLLRTACGWQLFIGALQIKSKTKFGLLLAIRLYIGQQVFENIGISWKLWKI